VSGRCPFLDHGRTSETPVIAPFILAQQNYKRLNRMPAVLERGFRFCLRHCPENVLVLIWMDGWYKGDSDEAIIDTDVLVANAKKFGTFCAANPSISIVNVAEKILGD
jgi:hypothetical protein